MFDVYMQAQGVRPDRRMRLLVSMTAAATLVCAAGTAAMIAERLGVDAVPAITAEQTLLFLVPQQAPEPPKPPKAVRSAVADAAAGQTAQRTSPARAERPAEDSSLVETAPAERPVFGGPVGPPRRTGNRRFPAGGARCRYVCRSTVRSDRIDRPETPPPPAIEPLSKMKMRAIYTPDPDPAELAKTPTGMMSRQSGAVTVGFCVEPNGSTSGVRVERSFGDRKVDQIARSVVRRWRFRATVVGGKGIKTCSEVTFRIEFD